MKTLIVIPAYNESNNLGSLINDINRFGYDYLIINDHSNDDTQQIAKVNGYNIINLPINIGIAGVTRIGFKYAFEKNYDCAICIDGDGQHQPSYVETLINAINEGYDYVIGSRFVTEKKPISLRMLGSRIISFFIKVKTGKTIHDPTSGMRAVGKTTLEDFSHNMNFYAEPDALCYLIKKNRKVKEVQVEMKERQNGRSYFRNPFKSLIYMINVIISIIIIK